MFARSLMDCGTNIMLRLACKAAASSTHSKHHIGALVVKGGRVLSSASNKVGRGCKLISNKRWENTLHAEANAILQLVKHGRQHELVGATVYVARVKKGRSLLAAPCPHCYKLCQDVGIKYVVYSTQEGSEKMKC